MRGFSRARCPAAAAILLLPSAAFTTQAQKLRSPWDLVKAVPTNEHYVCPAPPPFDGPMNPGSYYVDKHASVIDPQKLAAFQEASAAPTHLGQLVGFAADAYLANGSRAAARCVYALLGAAAKADAWTNRMPGFQGIYVQNWLLSGTAIPYLKVRGSGEGSEGQEAAIQAWFKKLAGRVREYFDAQVLVHGSDGWNNHLYWAGLAVSAEGVADDDRQGFNWGMVAYRMGVEAIQPDGSLAAEVNRAGMALHYHLYSVGPLIVLAEFGAANGLDLYAQEKGAIHRLVKFCVEGLENPQILEKRTGVQQVTPRPLGGSDIGWGVPYAHRFPNPRVSALVAKAQGTRFWQWGGAPPD